MDPPNLDPPLNVTSTFSDPRVKDWFLMSSPWPCLTIIFLYYILIKIGPLIMTNRKPMELRNVLVFYNVFMVMMTGYCGFQVPYV